MRVLILGGAGMLGHRLWITLRERHQAFVALLDEPLGQSHSGVEVQFTLLVEGSDHGGEDPSEPSHQQ